jgi:hypothetical protein
MEILVSFGVLVDLFFFPDAEYLLNLNFFSCYLYCGHETSSIYTSILT